MVRDSRAVLSRWAPPPDFTVAYGDHADHIADVRLPERRGVPLVLFLHGGFWRHGHDRTHVGPLAVALVAAGYAVAAPEYRRTGAPGGGWPGTFDDVLAAVRRVPGLVVERADVDPARLLLAGHSAGGHLALWSAAGLAREGRGPRGVVALAPVADLRLAYDLDLDRGAVSDLLGGGPATVPDRYIAADPMSLVPIGARVVVVHGDRDAHVPVELSRRFATAALAAGDDVELAELPDIDHFDVIDPESPGWLAVLRGFLSADSPNQAWDRPDPDVDGRRDSR